MLLQKLKNQLRYKQQFLVKQMKNLTEEMQDALLDMLVGDSSDEDSDENSDEDSEQEGGADTPAFDDEAVGIDITGMDISKSKSNSR